VVIFRRRASGTPRTQRASSSTCFSIFSCVARRASGKVRRLGTEATATLKALMASSIGTVRRRKNNKTAQADQCGIQHWFQHVMVKTSSAIQILSNTAD
jgi:hypothetical protein